MSSHDPSSSAPIDIKPRSRVVTDGIEATTSRGMLRAVGMGDADWDKPQIGIASSWNEITPCNLSLDRLAQGAKEGVHSGGGYPLQFGTISVSDGISMGHEGMHFSLVSREVIADSVETVMMAERLDGSVLLAGCDKSIPGMLMASARLDLSSVFLYAGSIAPGWVKLSDGTEKDVTIIDSFEAVGACRAGLMSEEDLKRIECAIAPGEGACGGMYTANTMASVAEALGLSLPGSAAPPAADRAATTSPTARARPWSTSCDRGSRPATSSPRRRSRTLSRWRWLSAAPRTWCCTCSRSPVRPMSS
jgi:dihydroxy-acid dehydratase